MSSPRVSLSFSFPSQMFLLCFLLAQFPLATPSPHPWSVPAFAAVPGCLMLLSLNCPSSQTFPSHCSVQEQQLNWVSREGVCRGHCFISGCRRSSDVTCKEWLMSVLLSSAASSPGSTSSRRKGARFPLCTNPGLHQCPALEAAWLS